MSADGDLVRRYLNDPRVPRNEASYRVDRETLAVVPGSYTPAVTRSEAIAALDRLDPPLDVVRATARPEDVPQ